MNAIILAAGLGSRFKDITKTKHKSLLEIDGIPNLERTIGFLNEFGIDEIYIVVGYLKEQFEYLKDKYNVKLICNDYYDVYNNIYSFYLAKDVFGDSLIIEGDIVLLDNIFKKFEKSTYYVTTRRQDSIEWNPVLNNKGYVQEIIVSDKKIPSLIGISYWNKSDSKLIVDYMNSKYTSKDILLESKLYWDNIIIDLFSSINIELNEVNNNHIFEMDNLEDYNYINNFISNSK